MFNNDGEGYDSSIKSNLGEVLTKQGYSIVSESQEPGIFDNEKKYFCITKAIRKIILR